MMIGRRIIKNSRVKVTIKSMGKPKTIQSRQNNKISTIMKKKILMVASAIAIVVSTSAAIFATKGWHVIDDTGCNKCVITDNVRKCGKCGSFMKDGKLEDPTTKGLTYECVFTCKNQNCKHTVRGGC